MTMDSAGVQFAGEGTGRGSVIRRMLLFVSVALVACGAAAFACQWNSGIGVTGKSRPVMWGFYITTFAFWCGASVGGVCLAASAQFSRARWLKRAAKPALATGLFALITGAVFPIIHLGRPRTFHWLLPFTDARLLYPNLESPLIADVLSLNSAIIAGLLFFYLSFLPNLAGARDRNRGVWRLFWCLIVPRWISGESGGVLHRRLLPAAGVLAACATVAVAWTISLDFFRTVNPLWNSPLFVPLFLAGCGYSGLAVSLLVLAALGHWATSAAGRLLPGAGAAWFALSAAECLRVLLAGNRAERTVLSSRIFGDYAPLFWIMVCACIIIPAGLAIAGRLRSRGCCVVGMSGIAAGMWLERFLIVVPTLANPRLSYARGGYQPTWQESMIVLASAGLFALLWLLLLTSVPLEDEHAPV